MIECTCRWAVLTEVPELLIVDTDCPGHGDQRLRHHEVTC